MGSTSFIVLVVTNLDVLLGPFIILLYPMYASIQALIEDISDEYQQWLPYWMLLSLITLFELTFHEMIEWIPLWSYSKLIFICWLVLPYFNGAAFVFLKIVRPLVTNTEMAWFAPFRKHVMKQPSDILSDAQNYFQTNLINKIPGNSHKRWNCKGLTMLEEIRAAQIRKASSRAEKEYSRSRSNNIYDAYGKKVIYRY